MVTSNLEEWDILDLRDAEEWGNIEFAAEMEARQFRAIEVKLQKRELTDEILDVGRIRKPRLGRRAALEPIRKWLKNGWNTEGFLRLTGTELDAEALSAGLQWSYPMAYYSVFAVTCAFFEAAGFTEITHAAIIKRFGELVVAGEYPPLMSFAANATKKNVVFHGIQKPIIGRSTIHFDPGDSESVDKHVCQFLKSTRERSLEEKKHEMKFRTKRGTPKKNLAEEEWARVSERLGPTSVLSLLYRKRIKAHYRDIDTFADANVDAAQIHRSLVHVVDCLNLVHEAIIAAAAGLDSYEGHVAAFTRRREAEFLERRLRTISEILAEEDRTDSPGAIRAVAVR